MHRIKCQLLNNFQVAHLTWFYWKCYCCILICLAHFERAFVQLSQPFMCINSQTVGYSPIIRTFNICHEIETVTKFLDVFFFFFFLVRLFATFKLNCKFCGFLCENCGFVSKPKTNEKKNTHTKQFKLIPMLDETDEQISIFHWNVRRNLLVNI